MIATMHKLTNKQKLALNKINEYINVTGYSPSFRDIAEKMNIISSSTVLVHLEKLKEKGYVTWKPGQPRTLQIL